MKKKWLLASVATISILALVGCGSSSTSSDNSSASNTNTTSQTSSSNNSTSNSNSNTTATNTSTGAGDATKGKDVFQANCAGCHSTGSDKIMGPGLQGETKKAKLENGKDMNDQNLADWIKQGGTGKIGMMPGFSSLSDQQISDLIAYLKTL
jgi:cytochrome c